MKKTLKNKRKSLKLTTLGFTLIELLAVIIILAIVALIATPIILDVVEDARESAGLSESNMIYSSINNYCASIEMKKQLGRLDSEDVDCSSKTSFTTAEISKMVNLGSATIESNSYSNGKLTNLVVISNNNKYVLCSNGSMALESDGCETNTPIEPSVPESVSFAEDSWETISAIVKAGKAEETYNVGDTKEVTLTGDWAGTYTVRIANNSTPEECSTEGFSQTACGFVVEFADIITKHVMNSTTTNSGGWTASEMYSFVNTDIYNVLPNDLQNVIIETYSVSGHGNQSGATNFTSTDKLYLLSTKELWGKDGTSNTINYDSAEAETRQLDYYKNNGVTTSNYSGAVKTYQGSAWFWWLRAANSNNSTHFYNVKPSGHWNNPIADNTLGVAPAFRIG